MIWRLTFFIFLWISVIPSYGVDSQNAIDNLLQIANVNIKSDKKLANKNALSALELAKKIGYKSGEAEAYWLLGRISFNDGLSEKSGELFLKSNKIYQSLGNTKMYATTLKDYADYLQTKGDYINATKNAIRASALADSIKALVLLSECKLLLGRIDLAKGDFPAATAQSLSSLQIAESINEKKAMVSAYLQLGNINAYQGDVGMSNTYFSKALELNQEIGNMLGIADASCNLGSNYLKSGEYDKAQSFIEKSITTSRTLDYKPTLALNLMNLGYLKTIQKDYKQAESLLKQSMGIFVELNDMSSQAEVSNMEAYLFSLLKRNNEAKNAYTQAIEKAQKAKAYNVLFSAYEGMSFLTARDGDFKSAYNYQLKSQEWREKLFNADNAKLVNQQQMNFQFEKIQKELEKEKLLQDAVIKEKSSRVRVLIGSIIAIVLLLGGLIFVIYQAYLLANKNKELLADKNQFLQLENENSSRIINQVLPSEIESTLKANEDLSRERLVHVMFIDFIDFSKYESQFDPFDLVEHMDDVFKILNKTSSKYHLETMKTMLDGYLCIAGLKGSDVRSDCQSIISCAFDIQSNLTDLKEKRKSLSKPYFDLRIGIHSGSLLGGVVGVRTVSSDIWGNTVQAACLVQKNSSSNLICISESTLEFLDKTKYSFSLYTTISESNGSKLAVYQIGLINDRVSINVSDSISDDFLKQFQS